MSTFIPHIHFVNPADKLKPEWCWDVINYYVYNSDNRSLLFGKNVDEIEQYSSGDFDMKPFMRMFKSLKKKMQTATKDPLGNIISNSDLDGLEFKPLPLIPSKLDSAAATIQKVPIEVECKAQDALAMQKKHDDIEFLKNKPRLEAELQLFADQLGVGKVDLGGTKNSYAKFSDTPMGLDLQQPDEEDIFAKLLYSLRVETAFEKALQQFYFLKKADQVGGLEVMDQLKFAVSVHQAFSSSITGLPDLEYIYPNDIDTPQSRLPDYGDNTHRIISKTLTVLELFKYFSDEICDEQQLDHIINGDKGYCKCNGGESAVSRKDFGTKKLNLRYIEVRTVDWVGVFEPPKSKRGVLSFTDDEQKCTRKIWGQNTYGFYWLLNTRHFFGIHRLGYAHRTVGQEARQNFSTNIYRSKKKSAVELSIGENKKAQIADIKLQHAIIMSGPAGKYIDLRFLRGALEGLKDGENSYTMQDLINLAFEKNHFIGDTQGFDGKNDGQLKPFVEIPGGLKAEVQGYIMTILSADENISNFTGINEQLTGQSANPEGLVGLQKLLINSSINAIQYCTEAKRNQHESLFNIWGSLLQGAIEKGGKVKQAMINFIGTEDVDLLDGLNDVPLHDLTIKVEIGQREVERQNYINRLEVLTQKNIITSADEFLLSGIKNPKERFALLAVREKKFMKEQERIRQEQYANQQALMKQQGENMMQTKQVEGEEKQKEVYAKGDVESKLMTLADKLGLTKLQLESLQKRALQDSRGRDQLDKSVKTIFAKEEAKRQAALV